MTRKELELLKKVLSKIKNPDSYVIECLHNIDKNIIYYDRRKGQLHEMNEYDYPW